MRWIIAALAALVLVLQYRIWLSPHGAREVIQLSRAVEKQSGENQKLALANQQLVAEVRDLNGKGYEALRERARSELGLIEANETYYQVVPPATAAPVNPAPAVPPVPAAALAAAR